MLHSTCSFFCFANQNGFANWRNIECARARARARTQKKLKKIEIERDKNNAHGTSAIRRIPSKVNNVADLAHRQIIIISHTKWNRKTKTKTEIIISSNSSEKEGIHRTNGNINRIEFRFFAAACLENYWIISNLFDRRICICVCICALSFLLLFLSRHFVSHVTLTGVNGGKHDAAYRFDLVCFCLGHYDVGSAWLFATISSFVLWLLRYDSIVDLLSPLESLRLLAGFLSMLFVFCFSFLL